MEKPKSIHVPNVPAQLHDKWKRIGKLTKPAGINAEKAQHLLLADLLNMSDDALLKKVIALFKASN